MIALPRLPAFLCAEMTEFGGAKKKKTTNSSVMYCPESLTRKHHEVFQYTGLRRGAANRNSMTETSMQTVVPL